MISLNVVKIRFGVNYATRMRKSSDRIIIEINPAQTPDVLLKTDYILIFYFIWIT